MLMTLRRIPSNLTKIKSSLMIIRKIKSSLKPIKFSRLPLPVRANFRCGGPVS